MHLAAHLNATPTQCSTRFQARDLFEAILDVDHEVTRAKIDQFIDAVGERDGWLDLHYVYAAAGTLSVEDFEYFVCTASGAPVLAGTELFQMIDGFWAGPSELPWETQKRVMRLAGYTGDFGEEELPAGPVVLGKNSLISSEAWMTYGPGPSGIEPNLDHLIAVVEPERLLAQRDTDWGRRYFVDDEGLAVLKVLGLKDPS